jgi:hypothetical protein
MNYKATNTVSNSQTTQPVRIKGKREREINHYCILQCGDKINLRHMWSYGKEHIDHPRLQNSAVACSWSVEYLVLLALTDIPVNEGTLGVHQIELVVQTREHLTNGGGVGDHAHGTLHLGKVTTGDNGWWLVVDSTLETSGAPVNKLDGTLGLDSGNSGVDVLGDNITTVHHAARHVLSMTGVALDHHGGGLEHSVGDLSNGELLVVCLLSRDDGCVGGKHEVDTWVWHQVGLELSDVNVQGTIEAQRGGQG